MTDRRSYALVVLAVFAVALAMRTIPLYWSPLPATLDGIDYAAIARNTIATGHIPLEGFRADKFVLVSLFSVVGVLLNRPPITLAQPFVAFVGAASCITAVAFAHRIGTEIGWPARRTKLAATLAGFSLAVSGVYLRRTSVPDEGVVVHLLLPLLALALYRALLSWNYRWSAVAILLLVLFPFLHTFSTLIAALVATGLLAVHLRQRPTIKSGALGVFFVGGFWAYLTLYYEFAERSGVLVVPYVDRIQAYPGLFLAWLIVLVLGVIGFRLASARIQRAVFLLPIVIGLLIVAVNVVTPFFPGTVSTPVPVLALITVFVIPVLLASGSLSVLSGDRSTSVVLLALIAAPIVMTYFSITASLTPDFFGTVMRTQTFAHFPVFILAALAVARYGLPQASSSHRAFERPAFRSLIVGALLVSAAVTAPLAFVNLDTFSYPSTTTESEFEAVGFTTSRLTEEWTSGDTLTRIATHYYQGPTGGESEAREWLRGGTIPCRPTLSQNSWMTTGAHFYPAAPETVSKAEYREWVRTQNQIYTAGGIDPLYLTVPSGTENC